MMSPDHNLSPKPCSDSTNRKTGSGSTGRPQQQDHQTIVKCPRCDSSNTKFCYYNNYSLTQPRHFCKTCRRYWTKGGALRNVPIGGGCRKNKKMKSSSSLSSRLSCDSIVSSSSAAGCSSDNNNNNNNNLMMGGFKFFNGLSPAMDFQLNGLSFPRGNPNPNLNPNPTIGFNQISSPSFGDHHGSGFSFDHPTGSNNSMLPGLNYLPSHGGGIQEMGSMNLNPNLASSIESLSSLNQDLHWKLQQQRLGMLFGGGGGGGNNGCSVGGDHRNIQKESSATTDLSSLPLEMSIKTMQPQQPMNLFQNLEISKQDDQIINHNNSRREEGETATTEWFFGNCYNNAPPPPPSSAVGVHLRTAKNNINAVDNDNDNNAIDWNSNNGSSTGAQVQLWNDLNQYSALP